MATLEQIKKALSTAEELMSVVRTMKTIAAVTIHQFEKAVEALADYSDTVEMGLQILFTKKSAGAFGSEEEATRPGIIVFGSDQGMVGRFNEEIASLMADRFQGPVAARAAVIAIGERLVPSLQEAGFEPDGLYVLPAAPPAITLLVQKILAAVEQWRQDEKIDQIFVFHNRPLARSGYEAHCARLLPFDHEWLATLAKAPWESRSLPDFSMDWDDLFSALISQHLFVVLYRACAESIAAENASRIVAMQAAEKNIEKRLETLNERYRHERQTSITEELLDIVSGFEAMTGK